VNIPSERERVREKLRKEEVIFISLVPVVVVMVVLWTHASFIFLLTDGTALKTHMNHEVDYPLQSAALTLFPILMRLSRPCNRVN